MKSYLNPELKIVAIGKDDVIRTSRLSPTTGGGNNVDFGEDENDTVKNL